METGVKGGAQVLTVFVMILAGLAALSSLATIGSRIYTLQSGKLPGQGLLSAVVKNESRTAQTVNEQWSRQVEQQRRMAPAVLATTLPYALVTAAVSIVAALLLMRRATRRQLMWLALAACLLRLPVGAVTVVETLQNVEVAEAAMRAQMDARERGDGSASSEKVEKMLETTKTLSSAMLLGSVFLSGAFALGVAGVFGVTAWVMSRRAPAVAAAPVPPSPLMN